MQSYYVTWYGHHHLVPLISISKASSWSPLLPAWHHGLHHLDLYQCVVTWSSRQLFLLRLLLSHSDKVKQLFGACILCNKETTIRLLPVADNFNKTWSSLSPAWHLDIHHRIIVVSPTIASTYNKATTIRLLPVADNFYKTWSSHTTIYISWRIDHNTSQQSLQKQVRRPLLCRCKFYVAATGLVRTVLTYASKPQR